jgi:hypothetical protein
LHQRPFEKLASAGQPALSTILPVVVVVVVVAVVVEVVVEVCSFAPSSALLKYNVSTILYLGYWQTTPLPARKFDESHATTRLSNNNGASIPILGW